MRIGIVTEYYRPWPGGISEHVHHEASELAQRGHEVVIFTGPATAGWRDDRLRVIRMGFGLQFTSNGALSRMVLGRYLLNFRRVLRSHQLDVLHVHAPMDPVLGMASLVASKCATVGTFHANFTPSPLWETMYRRLRFVSEPIWRRLDGCIAVSAEARRSISHYFPGEYEILPNGVDTERFDPRLEAPPALRGEGPKILFVGRADPRKGLPLLLRAYARARRRIEGLQLWVVGAERRELEDELRGLDAQAVRDVIFAGYVAPEALPGYYAACDLFCSPAIGQESQGIVLLEAMAAGRPPLAFSIPGYRDVVSHGRDGWLVEEIGERALADALALLLGPCDRLTRMAAAPRGTALGYA